MSRPACCPHCMGAGRIGDAPPSLTSPAAVASLLSGFARRKREHFVVLFLNTRNGLIGRPYVVSVGSLNASIVHPREVFKEAIRRSAAALIVAHNHPSGQLDPSEDDLAITRRLEEAGEILGIGVLDHVVIGRTGYYSLRETERI